MIKCIVIDDEPLALKQMELFIEKTPFLEIVAVFESAVQAIDIIKETKPDVMFVDIDMPDLNGIDFVKALDEAPLVVFTTAYSQYAVDGFRVNAVDYLLKPISYADFFVSANKIKSRFENNIINTSHTKSDDKFIFIKSEYKTIRINLNDIKYIESISEYMKIHLDNSSEIMSLQSLKSIEDRLPADKFMRVHRSYIVNLSKIAMIERNRIIFDNKDFISVSTKYKSKFQSWVDKNILT